MRLEDIILNGELDLELGVADPSSSGFVAGIGARGRATDGTRWVKFNTANTDWKQVQTGPTEPLIAANATARKALTNLDVGTTWVIQTDVPNIAWRLIDTDPSLDASWHGTVYTQDAAGTVQVSMELGNVANTITDIGVLGRIQGVPSIGDGATSGGFIPSQKPLPAGYLQMQYTNFVIRTLKVQHDGGGGATGVCVQIGTGAIPTYYAVAADTDQSISLPDLNGGMDVITIFPATNATGGATSGALITKVDNSTIAFSGELSLQAHNLKHLGGSYHNNFLDLTGAESTLETLSLGDLPNVREIDLTGFTCPSASSSLYIKSAPNIHSLVYAPWLNSASNSSTVSLNNMPNITGTHVSNPTLTAASSCVMAFNNLGITTFSASNIDTSSSSFLSSKLSVSENQNLTSVDLQNWDSSKIYSLKISDNPQLSTINLSGSVGSQSSSSGINYGLNITNNNLTTDDLYVMMDNMANAGGGGLYIHIWGNPAVVAGVIQDGATYTATQLQDLATNQSFILVLTP